MDAHIERQSLQLFTRNQRSTLCEKYGANVKSVGNGVGVARGCKSIGALRIIETDGISLHSIYL